MTNDGENSGRRAEDGQAGAEPGVATSEPMRVSSSEPAGGAGVDVAFFVRTNVMRAGGVAANTNTDKDFSKRNVGFAGVPNTREGDVEVASYFKTALLEMFGGHFKPSVVLNKFGGSADLSRRTDLLEFYVDVLTEFLIEELATEPNQEAFYRDVKGKLKAILAISPCFVGCGKLFESYVGALRNGKGLYTMAYAQFVDASKDTAFFAIKCLGRMKNGQNHVLIMREIDPTAASGKGKGFLRSV